MYKNNNILDMVKEITIAKMTNSDFMPTEDAGEAVADFMDVIYKKLVELNKNEDNYYPK